MLVAERFILNLVKRYGELPVSTDGGTLNTRRPVSSKE